MEFDNEKFLDELRARLKLLLKIKKLSMAKVSVDAGGSSNSLKEFLNGKKKSTSVTTLLGWARALDVSYDALLSSAETGMHEAGEPFEHQIYDEKYSVDENKQEERDLRTQSGKNLKFIRTALGHSLEDFARVARFYNGENPDASMIEAFENGDKLVPPMIAIRLAKAFGFSVEDIYN